MKIELCEISSCSEIEPGMIFESWGKRDGEEEPWIISRRALDGEPIFRENKVEELHDSFRNVFWAVPLYSPGIPAVLVCFDLKFDGNKPRFYRVVK